MATKSRAQEVAVPQPNGNDDVWISRDALDIIRDALLIGLSSYGEIERLLDEVEGMRLLHDVPPEGLVPMHPTGTADTVGKFADALRFVAMVDHCTGLEAAS